MRAETPIENVGVLFLKRDASAAAAAILGRVVRASPGTSPAWYGLGYALLMLSKQRDARVLLRLSLACFLRAIEEDRTNVAARDAVRAIELEAPLPELERRSVKAWRDSSLELLKQARVSLDDAVTGFRELQHDRERAQIAAFVGDHGELELAPLLAAALDEPDPDVCIAALKRVARFHEAPELRPPFERLVKDGRAATLEPHASSALHALVPTQPWAKELLAELERRNAP